MIKLRLTQGGKERDWRLFSLGVNGRLRVGDLSALKVDDVASDAGIKTMVSISTEKRGTVQVFAIPQKAQARLRSWITGQNLQPWDYLFLQSTENHG